MNAESSLDIPYKLNPGVLSSIKSADSMAVFGTGAPVELSLDLLRVLMTFAEKTTTRQAFHALDVDIDIDEFAKVVLHFVECGLLRHDQPVDDEHGLSHVLNPRVVSNPALVDKLGSWMRQGRVVIIPDALPADFAEQVYRDLDQSTSWRLLEGGHDFFHYRNCYIDGLDGRSPALAECSRLFKSTATRRFIGELSGQDCSGEARTAAAWYRPGEYALPHDDSLAGASRCVAYIWYLTKDWRQEWGGALFWCPTGQYIRPRFNTLAIFNALPSNVHFVCPVAPTATTKRLTINGFWHQAGPPPALKAISPDDVVSPRAYGPTGPEDPELSPVIVL
jgi:Rps23 Pro-64 3,4-dihydroxylase Tpa1-like proline 4-hydroxylase